MDGVISAKVTWQYYGFYWECRDEECCGAVTSSSAEELPRLCPYGERQNTMKKGHDRRAHRLTAAGVSALLYDKNGYYRLEGAPQDKEGIMPPLVRVWEALTAPWLVG
jgi:hypothetical protein